MHETRQKFCLDLFSMFHKIGSCSTLYFCLVMQIRVQYFIWKVPCLNRGEIWAGKKNLLNCYTRVNTGTKIKRQQVCQSLFSDCDGPKCAHAVINKHWILFLSRRHARRASASCQTSFSCFHIVFLRHHSKIRRQLQPKADTTLFQSIDLDQIPRSPFGRKQK